MDEAMKVESEDGAASGLIDVLEAMSKAPKLEELKSRPCSLEELQASLVKLIELHNGMHDELNGMIQRGQIRSRREAIMNTPYGL